MTKTLEQIAAVFRKDETEFLELSVTIDSYINLVSELSNFDPWDESSKEDIHFKNGKALGPTWAALCINDMIRTKKFVQGLFMAIESVKKTRKGPVHILYVGTGPYATLALPVMTFYSEEEVQFILMEINQTSIESVRKVISNLGFNIYVKAIINEEATKYVFKDDLQIDIVLCETMQRALEQEQQVPIMLNIIPQLSNDVIMIPEHVTLDLCLMNLKNFNARGPHSKETDYCYRLGKIFELRLNNLRENMLTTTRKNEAFRFPSKTIDIPSRLTENYNQLAICTEIQVFGPSRIEINESSLTIPLLLENLSDLRKDQALDIWYKVDEKPGVEYFWV